MKESFYAWQKSCSVVLISYRFLRFPTVTISFPVVIYCNCKSQTMVVISDGFVQPTGALARPQNYRTKKCRGHTKMWETHSGVNQFLLTDMFWPFSFCWWVMSVRGEEEPCMTCRFVHWWSGPNRSIHPLPLPASHSGSQGLLLQPITGWKHHVCF